MTEFTLELNRRRVLAGILVIGLAAAAAGVGTFALFSDEAQSDANTISAGTLSVDPVDMNFSVGNMYPTENTSQTITAEYSESGDIGSNLNVSIDVTNDAFAQQFDVDTAELTVNGGGVDTLASSGDTLSDLNGTYSYSGPALSNNDQIELDLQLTLGEDTTNTYQGESLDVTVTFNATQQTA